MKKITDIVLNNRLCEPFSTILGGFGLNLLGSGLQSIFNRKQSEALMDYQTEKQLHAQSILNQRSMPQMVSSMRMAGLNPALVSGPFQQSSSMPSASVNMPSHDVSSLAGAASQMELLQSQIDKTKAETNLLNEQSYGQQNLNDTFYMRLYTELENVAVQSNYTRGQTQMFEFQKENLKAATSKLNNEVNLLNQQILQTKVQTQFTKEQIKYYKDTVKASISQMLASSQYMLGKNKREAETYLWDIAETAMNTYLQGTQAGVNETQNAILEKTKQLVQDYGDAETMVNMVSNFIGSLGSALNGVSSLRKTKFKK